MRLTKLIIEQLLRQNEGFSTSTHNSQRNSSEDRTYMIADGKLHVRAQGKTSWADSRYDEEWVADGEETHRFLYRFLELLDTEGID